MTQAYWFRIGPLQFIINTQFSSMGVCYPRIFVSFPDNSYLNYDLYMCVCFAMKEADWFSWLDGTEILLTNIEDVHTIAKEYGIDWQAFEDMIFKEYEKATRED